LLPAANGFAPPLLWSELFYLVPVFASDLARAPCSQAIDFFAKRREEEAQEEEEEEEAAVGAVTAGASVATKNAAAPRQEWFSSWGLDEWDWGRGSSSGTSGDGRRRRAGASPDREPQDRNPTLGRVQCSVEI